MDKPQEQIDWLKEYVAENKSGTPPEAVVATIREWYITPGAGALKHIAKEIRSTTYRMQGWFQTYGLTTGHPSKATTGKNDRPDDRHLTPDEMAEKYGWTEKFKQIYITASKNMEDRLERATYLFEHQTFTEYTFREIVDGMMQGHFK